MLRTQNPLIFMNLVINDVATSLVVLQTSWQIWRSPKLMIDRSVYSNNQETSDYANIT